MSKHFDIDLAEGKLAEDALARILYSGREKVEHKRDRQCTTTGNLAVEYETSPQPNGAGTPYASGISVTTSYWWAIEFREDHRLLVPTETVKTLARAAIRAGRHKWIGESNRFHNALVPINWFWALPDDAVQAASAPQLEAVVEGWNQTLPTLAQAREYAKDGTFTPDAEGWAA